MSTVLTCSDCGKQLRVRAELAGKRLRCPACGNILTPPDPAPKYVASDRVAPPDSDDDEADEPGVSKARPSSRKTRQRSRSARSWLGILMALYFPFIGFICLISGGLAALFLFLATKVHHRIGGVLIVLAIFTGLTIVHVLWALRGFFQHGLDRDPLEFSLPDEWQEGLLELVEEVAESRQLPLPDEIRLTAGDVAYVYETPMRKRILVVGGLAIAAFTQEALAGIMAHELAHFGGGDTRRSRLIRYWMTVLVHLEMQFATWSSGWNPLIWLLRGYHLVFVMALSASSREDEYAADQFEVEHVGKEKAGATLVLLHVMEKLPWARLDAIAETFIADGQSLDNAFAEQVRRTRKASRGDWEDAFRKAMREETGSFDSHPCLKERLKAIGISPKKALAAALEQRGKPATELFLNWPLLEKFLSQRIMDLLRDYYLARQEFSELARAVMR